MIVTQHNVIPKFEFLRAQETTTRDYHMGLSLGINEEGPMAMSYEPDVGWVANTLGPTSGHWKWRTRVGPDDGMNEELGLIQRKREGSIPLREPDQNINGTKCRKCEVLGKENVGEETTKDGGVAVTARQHHPAKRQH